MRAGRIRVSGRVAWMILVRPSRRALRTLLRVWPEMGHAGSASCESAGEQSHVGEEEPCGSAGDGGFKVLGQASAAHEPGEGTLDHPAPRQQLEAFDARWALDNLDRPRAAIGDGGLQLRATIDT